MTTESALLKDQGNDHFKGGRYREAIEAYSQSIELDPTQHTTYSNRSASYMKLGGKEVVEALADAKKCVEIKPDWAKGHSRLATALLALNRHDDARVACEAGLAVSTDDSRENLTQLLNTSINLAFSSKLKGKWHGSVSNELGGYIQEFDFVSDNEFMVNVMDKTYPGRYSVDASQSPVHMDIQIMPTDAPAGFPPVVIPHIARLNESDAFELCCPYMSQSRPTSFAGPGYCELKRGGKPAVTVPDHIKNLTPEEKLLKCAEATIEMMPETEMEQPSPSETEEVAANKMLAQMKFQSDVFKLESTYGEATFKQVLMQASESTPPGGAYGEVIGTLREKMIRAKLMPTLEEVKEAPKTSPVEPVEQPKKSDSPKVSPSVSPVNEPSPSSLRTVAPYAMGAAMLLGATVLVFTWRRSRRQ